MTTETTAEIEYLGTASYSPDDNKIRIYPFARLAPEIYARVKAAGFGWAPKQGLFVAPMWTPEREDLATELCGEVGDEDKTLVERSEERAKRFDVYSDKREADAERAHDAVSAIADGIPLGQPILIGHHSEHRARKDAERIESGMRKAVKMWETSKYWTDRAAGALHHAKYKELPDVRARRIKGLEADLRKQKRIIESLAEADVFWNSDGITLESATRFAGGAGPSFRLAKKEGDRPDFDQRPSAYDCLTGGYPNLYAPRTLEEVITVGRHVYKGSISHHARWMGHFENRLAYEKAMLDEQGASHLIAPKKRPAQLPLLNYRQKEISTRSPYYSHREAPETLRQEEMTSEEFQRIYDESRGTRTVDGTHRVRVCCFKRDEAGKIERFPSYKATWVCVYLTDSKAHKKPEAPTSKAETPAEEPAELRRPIAPARTYTPPERTKFDDLKDSLKAGIKVVTAPQLFPTPAAIVQRMIDLADIQPGMHVLEPSAGTGAILKALPCVRPRGSVTACEINSDLVKGLEGECDVLICQDFLTTTWEDKFDRILMNPPFADGADIKHIRKALGYLATGGRLIAICAAGPRQHRELQPLATSWEELPEGTFASQGTGVRTILLTIEL